MKYITKEHRFGGNVVPADIKQNIIDAIENAQSSPSLRSSRNIKTEILDYLQGVGWSSKVELDPVSKISITSCKKKIGLVFQTGNMGRMYADLLKLQALYLRETIEAGVFIVPTYEASKLIGGNIANFDRLNRELAIFEKAITVPIIIYGFE